MLEPDREKHPCAVAGKEEEKGKGDTEKKSSSSPLYELSARDFWSSRYPVDAFSSAWHAAAGAQN